MIHHFSKLVLGLLIPCILVLATALGPSDSCAGEKVLHTTDLAKLINDYRADAGLDPLPLSGKLTNIARAHVMDAIKHETGFKNKISLHSWGKEAYNQDSADRLRKRARDIVGYTGQAYEVSAASSENILASEAIKMWSGSSGHGDTILSRGVWNNHKWKAMGVAYGGRYAYAWFGTEADDTPVDTSQPKGWAYLDKDTPTFSGGRHFKIHYFHFHADTEYNVELIGSFDTLLAVHNSAKKPVKQEDLGSNTRIVFKPSDDGVYSMLVTTSEPGATGGYHLSIQPVPEPAPTP